MPASRESASSEPRTGARVLVYGVAWVGDSVMSMPGLQAYRKAHPDQHITLLVKPALAPLWQLHSAPDAVLALADGHIGTLVNARRIRRERFAKAFILPHSFRSALTPWLARVPERIGMPGPYRDWMLTQVAHPRLEAGRLHQVYEYLDLLVPENPDLTPEAPHIELPADALAAARNRLAGLAHPRVAFIPGAARGPSKQWPAGHFVQLGRMLAAERGCGIVVLGSSVEAELCAEVAAGIGTAALGLAGRTSLGEWIALMKTCDLVVCNDSGGMHLAAAVGTPLVALYGITDPARTGPLGVNCRVLQNSAAQSRDVERDSAEARASLTSIQPEQVFDAALQSLERKSASA